MVLVVKNLVKETQEMGIQSSSILFPLSREDPLERKHYPTSAFLPEKFQGQRSLVGYSP